LHGTLKPQYEVDRNMHNLGKKVVRRAISKLGRHRWPVFDSHLLILAYHRVLPKADKRFSREQPGMRVSPETFEKNLQWASKFFQFISLGEWLELSKAGLAPKGKYCAVTFDDGWIDNYQYAFPILKKHSVPATIFCVGNMIDNRPDYWPGRLTNLVEVVSARNDGNFDATESPELAWLVKTCESSAVNWRQPKQEDFDKIIEAVKVYTDSEIVGFIDKTKTALSLDYSEQRQVVSSLEIADMLNSGLIEVGSHTTNHIRLIESTSPATLHSEIVQSRELLSSKLGCEVKLFCYPNGHHPDAAEKLVAAHYLGGCTLDRGWNRASNDFSVLKRVNLHEDVASDRDNFQSMLSGIKGM
jgi:peptidoglycan/xylan/chitin deacetylase (PgdA/CDA1 family)